MYVVEMIQPKSAAGGETGDEGLGRAMHFGFVTYQERERVWSWKQDENSNRRLGNRLKR